MPTTDTADAVVVGGGTVGAWCAYFLRRAGLARVVLIEKGFLGQGASSRAAGVVRVQGGTPEAVRAFCESNLTGYKRPKLVEFRTELLREARRL